MTTVKRPVRADRDINVAPKGVLPASANRPPTAAMKQAMPTIHH
jgi:hypothetical protein